jgi:hypothetical protein
VFHTREKLLVAIGPSLLTAHRFSFIVGRGGRVLGLALAECSVCRRGGRGRRLSLTALGLRERHRTNLVKLAVFAIGVPDGARPFVSPAG